jgi:hypothetical protein
MGDNICTIKSVKVKFFGEEGAFGTGRAFTLLHWDFSGLVEIDFAFVGEDRTDIEVKFMHELLFGVSLHNLSGHFDGIELGVEL